jgi:5-methylcytosine-specific restriction endonuclease McrA
MDRTDEIKKKIRIEEFDAIEKKSGMDKIGSIAEIEKKINEIKKKIGIDKIDEIEKKIEKGIKLTANEEKAIHKIKVEECRKVMHDLWDTLRSFYIKDLVDDKIIKVMESNLAEMINILLTTREGLPPEVELTKEWLISKGYKIGEPENKERRGKIKILRRKKDTAFRNKVMQRFGRRCFNCGSTHDLVIDHHFPAKDWTELTENNAVVLCDSCNKKKSGKAPEDIYSLKQLFVLNELYGIAKTALEVSNDSLPEYISGYDICKFFQQNK